MAYYDALVTKWATLTPGTTQAKLDQLNAMTVAGPAQQMLVPTYAIYNALVPADFQALTAAQQQLVRDVLSMGTVDVSPGTNARVVLQAVFSGKPNTIASFAALAAKYDATQVPWWKANGYSSSFNTNDLEAAGGLV
jgi:hypothetical protein